YIDILELLRFKSSLPLLLIAKEKIVDDQDFIKILKACAILSIRYSISKTRTNKLESSYNKISTEKIPDFLRSVINSQIDLVTKNRLFKEVKKNIKTSEEAFNFISKLHKLSSLYLALQNSNHSSWNDFTA
ncbi:hypothetical protein, partial [Campylobacter jejuni]|uniref:hypothetical protein n=1 Tax=Campylobacter jejuni TaxID=197 RepID=UPI0005169EBB